MPQGPSLRAAKAAANLGQSESWALQGAGLFRAGPLLTLLVWHPQTAGAEQLCAGPAWRVGLTWLHVLCPSCSRFGFPTMFPGNRTHNAVCSPGLTPAEPRGLLAVVLLTLVACVLVLTATQLGLHIWQLKRLQAWPPGQLSPGVGAPAPSLPAYCSPSAEVQLLPEAPPAAEDACSCQFPEEEHGERLSEDKGRRGHLWA